VFCGRITTRRTGEGALTGRDERPVADTPLAQWLNEKISGWEDPATGRVGLSLNKFSKLSGVAQSTTHEILKEGATPRAENLVKIADFFDVSPMVLFRLAYAPQTAEQDFPPEIRAKLAELEGLLDRVPADMQLQFLEGLMASAEMQIIAVERWRETEPTKE
jgi:transcriptional regulator with XRE-family HTH domain